MSDLISRQAAIDALCNDYCGGHQDCKYYPNCENLKSIEQLPYAQPELRWIPCSERLPDDDRTKVVTLANGNAEAGYYSNGDWWCIGDTISLENPIVIAWMPLPEPYDAESEDKE